MSVDIASFPLWKLALIERKRRQDTTTETSNNPNAATSETVDMSDMPPWKQEILFKRQQKKTTILLESLPKESRSCGCQEQRSQTDVMSPSDGHLCRWPTELSQIKNELSESNIRTFDRRNHQSTDRNSIHKYDNGVDDNINGIPVMEERLPPIHQNPILLKDLLQKRQHSSLNQGSLGSQSPNSHENVLPNVGGEMVNMSENENVFGENAEEVAYGKGFVHRLLRKFSHLADKEDHHVTSVPPVQWSRSLSRGYSTEDFIKPHTICSPTTSEGYYSTLNEGARKKVHSLDDLLNDKKEDCSVSQAGSVLNYRNDVRKQCFGDESQQLKGKDKSMLRPGSAECSIVFTARSIFENLATSPVAATKSSFHNYRLFSCDVVSEKPEPQLKSKNRDHHHHHSNDNVIIENHFNTSAQRNAYSPAIINSKPTWLNADIKSEENQLKTVVDIKKSGGNSPIIMVQKPLHISNSKKNISIMDNEEVKLIGRSNDAISSLFDSESTTLSSERPQHHTTKLDKEDISSTSGNIPLKPALTDTSSIYWQKTNGLPNQDYEKSGVTVNKNFNKSEDTSFQDGLKLLKKSSPSRPGMLIIRPASNLVTSKAKTDYVEMVKYNDITRGDFAPPTKIIIPKVRDEENDDDNSDELDSIMNDPSSILKFTKVKFEFEGAGVRVGRSLLTKSKVGKKLRISFDDSATTTFEYPSEQSVLDSFPLESDDFDYPNVGKSGKKHLQDQVFEEDFNSRLLVNPSSFSSDSVTAQYLYNPSTFDGYEEKREGKYSVSADESDEETIAVAM